LFDAKITTGSDAGKPPDFFRLYMAIERDGDLIGELLNLFACSFRMQVNPAVQ
jgi:hypothetical protein